MTTLTGSRLVTCPVTSMVAVLAKLQNGKKMVKFFRLKFDEQFESLIGGLKEEASSLAVMDKVQWKCGGDAGVEGLFIGGIFDGKNYVDFENFLIYREVDGNGIFREKDVFLKKRVKFGKEVESRGFEILRTGKKNGEFVMFVRHRYVYVEENKKVEKGKEKLDRKKHKAKNDRKNLKAKNDTSPNQQKMTEEEEQNQKHKAKSQKVHCRIWTINYTTSKMTKSTCKAYFQSNQNEAWMIYKKYPNFRTKKFGFNFQRKTEDLPEEDTPTQQEKHKKIRF